MLRLVMPPAVTIAVDALSWGVFHAATGYAAYRLDESRLSRDGWLLRQQRFETAGRWYRRRLRIDRWKDKLPEAGGLFRGGVSKRHLPGYDVAGLELFVRETRRAELAHWWALCCGPVFVLWNPPLAAGLLIGYGVVVNLPFVLIQRYNRFRTQALLERLSRRCTEI
jgi:glycosyl-4,4'-diaponeurosporenoate acyltransferase